MSRAAPPTPPGRSRASGTDVHRVVVIGSGFGGLFATKALRRERVSVTLIDRTSHHLFQPLLYQVATGILSEGEIAPPTRDVLRRQPNARVLLGEVTDIDLVSRTVTSVVADQTTVTPYDSLIVSAGSGQSYFGRDDFAASAPGMKDLSGAIETRARIFGAFELAEVKSDPGDRSACLTFVVIGGGPTGVEMAGQLAELSRRSLRGNFRTFDPASATVLLLEAGPRLLTQLPEALSRRAQRGLEREGVQVRVGSTVVGVDDNGVDVRGPDGEVSRIPARVKIWAAGVTASPLAGLLAQASGAPVSTSGQVAVQPDCSLPGHPEVFVVGDMMHIGHAAGVAQVAIQSGRFAARRIAAHVRGDDRPGAAFHYLDKGTLATISRFRAVATVGPVQVGGFVAWMLWLTVHLFYLIGFKNRVSVLMHWTVTFLGNGRSERTSPLPEPLPHATHALGSPSSVTR